MLYVALHAAWMILAVAVGTVAGYQGLLRATQRPDRPSLLPGRFLLRAHASVGTVYYAMLYAGILFGWVVHEYLLDGRVLSPSILRWHIALAGAIAVLYGAAWILGAGLVRRPAPEVRARPRLHLVFNFSACALVAVQIALAVYYVWIWPATV
ncbi:MAG: hypothetical protein WBD63_03585 [Phycisphaerae bacterium]|nr:hypothetical protein [Phycisphaerae bacterium]